MKPLLLLSAAALWVLSPASAAETSPQKAAIGNWGVDTSGISKTIRPGDDFYRYVNEAWLKTAQIPPGLANAETARFEGIGRNGPLFRPADGDMVALAQDDPMLKRIDLAYAANAHASQGATADMAMFVAQSTESALINRSLVGALFTRTREQVTFVVDNLSSFERRARENAGEKASALEIASEKAQALETAG